MPEFNHPLAQNDEQWEGYTVFNLKFNDVPIKFVTLVDAKHVLEKARNSLPEAQNSIDNKQMVQCLSDGVHESLLIRLGDQHEAKILMDIIDPVLAAQNH
jgi:hypothetical protein